MENVTTADAAYIVAACNSLPGLIAENRALRERVRELEAENRTLGERLCETEHDLTEALDKKEELERQNKELILWNYEFQLEGRRLQFQLEQAAKEAGE